MRYSSAVLPLAVAGGALANPLVERGDSCVAAVTGGPIPASIRSAHCASLLTTTVYPVETAIYTVEGICTTKPDPACKPSVWKRDLTVWSSAVPTYASACTDPAAYSSACSWFGFTDPATVTTTTTTTTKTTWVVPTGWTTNDGGWVFPTATSSSDPTAWTTGYSSSDPTAWTSGYSSADPTGWTSGHAGSYGTCKPSTTTIYSISGTGKYTCAPTTATVTATKYNNSTATVTATVTATPTADATCLTGDDATTIVNGFIDFLEHTNNGTGFNTALADTLLASDFTDTSDSIDFLAGIPLGSVTFASPAAFIAGQGNQPEIPSVTTLNLWHDCHIITWRWLATGIGSGADEVIGINVMIINDDKQIETNYSEFDSAAWLVDIGNPECATSSATTATTTATAKRRSYRSY